MSAALKRLASAVRFRPWPPPLNYTKDNYLHVTGYLQKTYKSASLESIWSPKLPLRLDLSPGPWSPHPHDGKYLAPIGLGYSGQFRVKDHIVLVVVQDDNN